MSPRRTLSALGLGTLAAGLVAACLPWTVELPAAARFVSRGLEESWGVALAAQGPTEVVLLPLPRVAFGGVRLTEGAPEGPVLASGGRLSLQLDLAALLTGRVEVESLTLDGADVLLPQAADDPRWSGAAARLARSLSAEGGAHPRRLVLSRARLTGRDPRDGALQTARDVDLALSWPAWSESAALAGRLTWNGRTASLALSGLSPKALVAGGASPFSARVTWPEGSLSAEGSGSLRDGLRATGTGSLQTRSLRASLAWLGGDMALSPFVEDLAVEGSFEAAAREVQFPSLKVTTGGNVLEGAGSASFGPRRAAMQATLAADSLNLSPLLGDLLRLTGFDGAEDGAWRANALDLRPLTGGDLDLRISAASARIGPVQFADLASSVLVRERSVEAALGRAGVQGGTVKGRVVLAADERDRTLTRVKALGSFDGIDLGALLIDLGQYRWMLGTTRGSLALEGAGRDVGALAASVAGRVALRSEDGAIAGLDLADVIHRGGAIAPGALARRNGRTAFEQAALSLLFSDGVGEIVEGTLAARALTASLSGRIGLPDRRFEARAELMPRLAAAGEAAARPATLFEMSGPWDAVGVRAGTAQAEAGPLGPVFRRPGADLPLGIRAYAPAAATAP